MEAQLLVQKSDAKTQRWEIRSKSDGSVLGIIKWFGPWRQYCFVKDDLVFSAGCFRDNASFLEDLNRKHKQGK
jgi:hypothetical protein